MRYDRSSRSSRAPAPQAGVIVLRCRRLVAISRSNPLRCTGPYRQQNKWRRRRKYIGALPVGRLCRLPCVTATEINQRYLPLRQIIAALSAEPRLRAPIERLLFSWFRRLQGQCFDIFRTCPVRTLRGKPRALCFCDLLSESPQLAPRPPTSRSPGKPAAQSHVPRHPARHADHLPSASNWLSQ